MSRISQLKEGLNKPPNGQAPEIHQNPFYKTDSAFHTYVNMAMRLVRPLAIGLFFAMIFWSIWGNAGFITWAKSLAVVPAPLWELILAVFLSIAVSKGIRDVSGGFGNYRRTAAPSMAPEPDLEDLNMEELGAFANTEEDDQNDVLDTPAENSAIDEWKNRASA